MAKVRTHYENLKVARDAPPEVIRAAYRSLSQKYHPDKNQGDEEAARVMTVINISYEVLSDPVRRRDHDRWISMTENGNEPDGRFRGDNHPRETPVPHVENTSGDQDTFQSSPYLVKNSPFWTHILRNWYWYGFGILTIAFLIYAKLSPQTRYDKSYEPAPPTAQAQKISPKKDMIEAVRPESPPSSSLLQRNEFGDLVLNAHSSANPDKSFSPQKSKFANDPNGRAWPTVASYIAGFDQHRSNGLSSVTIDNSRNDSDVFVKLVYLGDVKAYPVRVFFIPAHAKFSVENVTSGTYDIRYRDLKSGRLSRSEPFTLKETSTYDGIRYSNITMTLYKVRDGNMESYPLAEEEF